METKIITTGDGSHTLAAPGLNEHYHSVHGAVSESLHIFINAGLKFALPGKKEIKILETGFGTGLNALLTYRELFAGKADCEYTTIEAYPLPEEICCRLNYPEMLNIPAEVFMLFHKAAWNKKEEISSGFILNKINCKAEEMILPENYFDVVYFDAFAPDVQPEMWTEEIFRNIFRSMKSGAALTTYSTKGSVKRTLKETGFSTEKLPGPKGKREILRAVKI